MLEVETAIAYVSACLTSTAHASWFLAVLLFGVVTKFVYARNEKYGIVCISLVV